MEISITPISVLNTYDANILVAGSRIVSGTTASFAGYSCGSVVFNIKARPDAKFVWTDYGDVTVNSGETKTITISPHIQQPQPQPTPTPTPQPNPQPTPTPTPIPTPTPQPQPTPSPTPTTDYTQPSQPSYDNYSQTTTPKPEKAGFSLQKQGVYIFAGVVGLVLISLLFQKGK